MEGILTRAAGKITSLWENIEPMVRYEFIYRHNYLRYMSYPIGLLVVTTCFLYGQWPSKNEILAETIGDKFFSYMMVIFIMLTTSVGCLHAALSVSTEKEKKTLTVLRMSGVTSFDIIAGKAATSFLFTLFIILPHLPLVLACPFLGGITFTKVFAGLLILAIMTLFYSTSGVILSALVKKNYIATTLAVILLFSVHVGVYFLDFVFFEEYNRINYGYGSSGADKIAVFFNLSPVEIWQAFLWDQSTARDFYYSRKLPSVVIADLEVPTYILIVALYFVATAVLLMFGSRYLERYLRWRED